MKIEVLLHKLRNYGIIEDDRKKNVELNDTELTIATNLGKEKAKIGRSQVGFVEDSWQKHFLAYCGEMAFCKIMNIYFSPIIDPSHNYLNDKGDGLWGGWNVDVKHSTYDIANLAVQKYAINADVDIYALITGKPPTFKYQGAILKKDLIVDNNFGTGPKGFENAYCMISNKLEYYWWNRIKIELSKV